VAAALVAVFPTVEEDSLVLAEAIHDGVSLLSFVAANAAMYALAVDFRRDPRWRPLGRATGWLALCATGGVLAFISTSGQSMIGVAQRLGMLVVYSWLLATTVRLLMVTVGQALSRSPRENSPSVSEARHDHDDGARARA